MHKFIQIQAAGAILLPFSLGDCSAYLAYVDCHNFQKGAWYADDFIVTGKDPDLLRNEVMPIIRDFLQVRGLQLSERKSR